MAIRILLVDDDALVRTGLRMILESEDDFCIVGEAANGVEALQKAADQPVDVILMDIRMPEMDGIEATRRIVESTGEQGPRVIVLTTFESDENVFEALRAGASGFLLKRAPAEDLVDGIRVVAGGDSLLAPSVTRRLIREFVGRPPIRRDEQDGEKINSLTQREFEVLSLVSQGLSNMEIAGQLTLSEGTVKTHVKRIFSKLEVRDRTQAVILAFNSGLVQPESGA